MQKNASEYSGLIERECYRAGNSPEQTNAILSKLAPRDMLAAFLDWSENYLTYPYWAEVHGISLEGATAILETGRAMRDTGRAVIMDETKRIICNAGQLY